MAFSCRGRSFCPSCEKKRQILWAEWLCGQVLADVAHRHVVLTIPRLLRPLFRRRRELLTELGRAAAEAVSELVRRSLGDDASPGVVVSIATAGDLVQWHPHLHLLTSDGGKTADGSWQRLPEWDAALLMSLFRERLLARLVEAHAVSPEVVKKLLAWRHPGFSAHVGEPIAPEQKQRGAYGLFLALIRARAEAVHRVDWCQARGAAAWKGTAPIVVYSRANNSSKDTRGASMEPGFLRTRGGPTRVPEPGYLRQRTDEPLNHRVRCAEEFVLTPLQKGFLAESLAASDHGINVEQVVWELDRIPDAERFRAAWQSALDAFDALRLSFVWPGPGKEPRQFVVARVRLPFQRVDCPERSEEEQNARLEGFLDQDRRAGLDLSSTPLMRVSLLVLGSRAVCVWTVHHAVIDGNSYASVLQRVFDELGTAGGRAAASGEGPPQFTDFLRWLERHDPEPGTRHFAELLRGSEEPTPAPLHEQALAAPANRSSLTSLRLDPEASARLRATAQATGTTPNTIVQLAWALLLSRYAGTDDVVFGATWSGRARTIEQAARVVGPFVNTLPVRVRLHEAGTVRELLGALRRQHVALHPFQQTALGDIRARSGLAGFAQLFQTNVVFENERFHSRLLRQDGRWRGHRLWSRSQTSLPLVLAAYFLDDVLVMDLEYAVGLYSPESARRLLSDFRRLLTNVSLSLDASPYAVPMLDEDTHAQLTVVESGRELPPTGRTAIQRILERASSNARATAVRERDGHDVSYGELEARVRRLAGALRDRGIERGSLVGVLLPRSIDAVVSLLAVHAAGGAFVPLDPAAPSRRLEFIVRDSGAKVVLVRGETRGRLESAGELELDVGNAVARPGDDSRSPLDLPDATNLAYVIYTSGSTGEPKGVCVEQGALANHLTATIEAYALSQCDRVLQFAPPAFDVYLEEIIPTLAVGATLLVRSERMAANASDLFDVVASEGLTVLNLPTAFWHQLVRAQHLAWPQCLRLVVVGGEPVSPEAHRVFRATGTRHIRWMNAYGPTEAAITSTCYDDAEGDHTSEFVPIGRPLPGVSHFVFDPHMRLAPVGQPGQLYIGGAGLASGYLKRDDLTRQRFVPHPFRQGARLFATGDRVRRTEAGSYVYLGRLDDQVKVRGYRVELGEVEARLRQHPAVGDAAVVKRKGRGEEGSLVGFVVPKADVVTVAELREHLSTTLPPYMVPSHLAITPELPITPSGKIDRRALAELVPTAPEAGVPASAGDSTVDTLLHIWSDLLDRPVTDAASNFFDLGGDSLLVVEMFSEVERRLGRGCDAVAFFGDPTVGNLARLLRPATRTDWSAPLLVLATGKAGVRPLFLAPAVSGRGIDYIHVASAMSPDIPVRALQTRALREPHLAGESLTEAAAYYASLMKDEQPKGPYAVAGFSLGGVVAMAIAEELHARGESTDFVALVDSVPPWSVPVLTPFTSPRRLARFSRTLVGRVQEARRRYRGLPALLSRIRSAVSRGAMRWGPRLLEREHRIDEMFGGLEAAWTDGDRQRALQYFDAVWRHGFRRMSIDIVLFRVALDPFEGPHEEDLGWSRVTTGTIAIEPLPGIHEDVLTPAGARTLASRLESHLRRRGAPGPASPR